MPATKSDTYSASIQIDARVSPRLTRGKQITNRLIEAIEKGAGDFKLPWLRPAGSITRPTNIQSKKAYRGINVVTLWVEAQLRGYEVPVWGTYKQFQEAGCQVRKGEKSSVIVFYKEIEFERNAAEVSSDEDKSGSAWMARGYAIGLGAGTQALIQLLWVF